MGSKGKVDHVTLTEGCPKCNWRSLTCTQPTVSPNTATQVLVYGGETLSGSSNKAAGFASHFQSLATPSTNDEFDADHFTQVQIDVLLMEESCWKVSASLEPAIVRSLVISAHNQIGPNLPGH